MTGVGAVMLGNLDSLNIVLRYCFGFCGRSVDNTLLRLDSIAGCLRKILSLESLIVDCASERT